MRYLVDANVLSEATRPQPNEAVVNWLRKHMREVAVDPIILGEVQFGILLLPEGKRRRRLEDWFDEGVALIECLSWDATTALCWAQLLAKLRQNGRAIAVKDSLIAATAIRYNLTIATRNVRDFLHAGVSIENPFE